METCDPLNGGKGERGGKAKEIKIWDLDKIWNLESGKFTSEVSDP